jgi:ABC-type nitrate/sulfonate/bicarbonate transport system substrate-binding protein
MAIKASKEEVQAFTKAIEELVAKTDYNYIEAIVEYCKNTGLEIEVASSLISPALKSKIHYDAQRNNMLKEKSVRLPF